MRGVKMLNMKVTVQVVNDSIPWDNTMIHSVEHLEVTETEIDQLLGFLMQIKEGDVAKEEVKDKIILEK